MTLSAEPDASSGTYWQYIVAVVLALFSACFSGLNLGFMGLEPQFLEILAMGPFESKEDEKTAGYAKKLIPLRKRGHLLLCTILLGNVAVNALFSILISEDAGGVAGFVSSTIVIFLFGEIIP